MESSKTPLPDPLPARRGEGSYYDLPLLKSPVWTWEVPAYFFVGGAAGAAAVLGAAAQLAGADEDLVRDARWIAAAGSALSAPLLIADLGRPERFLHMLRVFKVQSPMSVGAWTLAAFGSAATAAAFADLVRRKTSLPVKLVGDASALLSAATGLVMATYTGVLIGATAIPAWNQHAHFLPVHFGASALGSAVSLLELRGHKSDALNALGLGAALFETLGDGGVFSGPIPLALRLLGARKTAAVSTLIGSLLTRYAWIRKGKESHALRMREPVGK